MALISLLIPVILYSNNNSTEKKYNAAGAELARD